eukprot:scaffold983_cov168-Amphora_coffeaeformis.AAC.4
MIRPLHDRRRAEGLGKIFLQRGTQGTFRREIILIAEDEQTRQIGGLVGGRLQMCTRTKHE